MTLPSVLQKALDSISLEDLLVLAMGGMSLLVVAIALERLFFLLRVRSSIAAGGRVLVAARRDGIAAAGRVAATLSGPTRAVFGAGLDRAQGKVRGEPSRAMLREQRRLQGAMRARTWLLGTTGALMPFVGLFGTVLGVMDSFQAIGESGQGGFAIVSVGISQALIATAVGIAVALEAVVLFNVLQSIAQRLSRDLALLVDELLELIEVGEHPARAPVVAGGPDAGSAAE